MHLASHDRYIQYGGWPGSRVLLGRLEGERRGGIEGQPQILSPAPSEWGGAQGLGRAEFAAEQLSQDAL